MLAPTSTTLDPLSALTATKDAIASFTNNLTNTTTTTPHLSASPSDAGASIEQLHLAAGLINSKRSVDDDDTVVLLDGYRLSLGDVVAAARRHKKVRIDEQPAIKARIDESVEYLKSKVSSLEKDTMFFCSWNERLTCLRSSAFLCTVSPLALEV